ncbi:hypothetical protein EGW08_005919 [Elysia chlorotica]|uniref:Uncharacterized protein n=1 Tax=Elysia chlorotica TaxID=188477 RepID=A0A3S1BLA5_ELYCH|nr:hypothetical protein EGW08_005919 [Elysia chlorotica]
MMNQSSSNYPGTPISQSDMFSSSSLEAGDPSTLTRAQQEELEMYYRKGTDQHLTFLRNMREAHAMYPFTGKRDKELFEKALAEMLRRLPILKHSMLRLTARFSKAVADRRYNNTTRKGLNIAFGQFKSPGQGPRGQQYGRQAYHGAQAYQGYGQGNYPGTGTPVHPGQMGMERRMSAPGSEGDSFIQGQGDDSYDYQQGASDDSRDTQHSLVGDPNQAQQSFHGAFGNGSGQMPQQPHPGGNYASDPGGGAGNPIGSGQQQQLQQQGPPDIKVEPTPVPFMSANEFELIEIDPDEEEDI